MVSFNYLFATVLAATAVVASPVVASDENVSLEARAGQVCTVIFSLYGYFMGPQAKKLVEPKNFSNTK